AEVVGPEEVEALLPELVGLELGDEAARSAEVVGVGLEAIAGEADGGGHDLGAVHRAVAVEGIEEAGDGSGDAGGGGAAGGGVGGQLGEEVGLDSARGGLAVVDGD